MPTKAARTRLLTIVLMLLALLLAAVVATLGQQNGGYDERPWELAALTCFAIVGMLAAVGAISRDRVRGLRAVALGAMLAYVAFTALSIMWAANQQLAWEETNRTALYGAAMVIALVIARSRAAVLYGTLATALGAAAVGGWTLAHLSASSDLLRDGQLWGTVGYHNGEAAFLLVPFWAAIALAGMRDMHLVARAAALAAATLSLQLAVVAESRGAAVALLVSVLVFAALTTLRLRGLLALLVPVGATALSWHKLTAIYQANGQASAVLRHALASASHAIWLTTAAAALFGLGWALVDRRIELPRRATRALGAIAIGAIVVLVAAGGVLVAQRTDGHPVRALETKWRQFKQPMPTAGSQTASRFTSLSNTGRLELWRVARRDFREHPVAGIGAANYAASYFRYRSTTAVGAVRQPHNLTLENLAERGIIGTLLLLIVLVSVAVKAVKLRRSDASVQTRALAAGLTAGIVYWLVHSQAEWFWQLPAVTLPAFIYMGFVLGAPWRLRTSRPLKAYVRWPLVTLSVVLVLSTAATYLAHSYVSQSEHYATSDPAKAVTILQRAARLDPVSADIQQQLANRAEAGEDFATARRAVAAQIANDPQAFTSYLFASQYYDRNGDAKQAQQLLAKARTLDPLDPSLEGQAELIGEGE